MLLRSDCGSENSVLAACHMLLRHNHSDEFAGNRSFRYGSSTTNTVCLQSIVLNYCIIIIIYFYYAIEN